MKLICAMVLAASTFAFAAPQNKADNVNITIGPDSPVVIDTDYLRDPSVTVYAPWIASVVNIENKSNEPFTIIALQFTSKDAQNQATSTTGVFPSSYNFTMACDGNASQNVTYEDFGEYAPGENSTIKLDFRGVLGSGCTQPATLHPTLYVDRLGTVGHHAYNIEMHVIGWFGTLNAPTTRFEKVVSFSTN